MNNKPVRIFVCTVFALLAFAGNSVLCRMALGDDTIDAASFTAIRLLSGIVILMLAARVTSKAGGSDSKGSWLAAGMLFLYALTFSFGYISLDTGTGALILFGAVQITMVVASYISGHRLHYSEWSGLLVALSGFVYLILPGVTTPSLSGFILMTVSGIAWGIYTLRGRASANPLGDTAYNFLRTSPFVLVLILFAFTGANITPEGAVLAVLSGAVASGLGYFVWYLALGGLTVTQAAVVQLFVPVLAAIGGVIFADEVITLRLAESSVLVILGILTVIMGKRYLAPTSTKP